MGLLNNDVVQTTWEGIWGAQQILMVRNYLISGDFPPINTIQTDLNLITSALTVGGVNDVETPYLACLSATYSLLRLKAQRIFPTRTAYAPLNFVGGAPGTNAGATTKPNVSTTITFRTALAGRKQRSNVHVGPSPDTAAVAGLVTAPYQALLSTLAGKLILSFVPPTSGSLVIPIIFHGDHTNDFIQNAIIQNTSRVQRRRTVGVGK